MRHMPFKVTAKARERWVAHMHAAIVSADLELEDSLLLHDHVERASTYLINAD